MDFLEREVLPALFDRLDAAFPEFAWTRRGNGWAATKRETAKKLIGARPARVVCNQPWGFYVYGQAATPWVSYVHNGNVDGVAPRGRDFVEAVRRLAELAGVDSSPLEREPTQEEERHHEERERRAGLLETFFENARLALQDPADAKYFLKGFELVDPEGFGCLAASITARDYLKKRGFEDLADFGFYTSPKDVRGALESVGFTPNEIEASGLLEDPRWAGRLVIPWRDPWGHPETLAARDLTGKADEGAEYLYLSSVRKAALVAFGLDVAFRNGGRERLVLVEGLLDALALHARGVRNVAAIGGVGKELTAERWEALASLGIREVVLVLDNDAAGREGTLAALANADKAGKAPKVCVVDPAHLGAGCKDPADFALLAGANASGAFRALLENRVPGARVMWE